MDEEKEVVCCSKCCIMYVMSFHVDFGMQIHKKQEKN